MDNKIENLLKSMDLLSIHGFNSEIKRKFLQMPIDEKRNYYSSKNYVTIDNLVTINDHMKTLTNKPPSNMSGGEHDDLEKLSHEEAKLFSNQITIWKGDITKLEVDAIVNAANGTLLGGGGVDGAIHKAASQLLVKECKTLNGCETGEAKITGGYCLPANYVIHTVGPIGENPTKLNSCYSSCLDLMKSVELTTIAFPCVSTGVYGYPKEPAARIAIKSVLGFLRSDYGPNVKRIIFTLFNDTDVEIYERLLKICFSPIQKGEYNVPETQNDFSVDTPLPRPRTIQRVSSSISRIPRAIKSALPTRVNNVLKTRSLKSKIPRAAQNRSASDQAEADVETLAIVLHTRDSDELTRYTYQSRPIMLETKYRNYVESFPHRTKIQGSHCQAIALVYKDVNSGLVFICHIPSLQYVKDNKGKDVLGL